MNSTIFCLLLYMLAFTVMDSFRSRCTIARLKFKRITGRFGCLFKQREIEDDIGTYAAPSIPAPASQLYISAFSRWRKGRKKRKVLKFT